MRVFLLAFVAIINTVTCLRPTKSTETFFFTKKLPQQDWSTVSIDGNRAGNMMPSVGNGYVGTVILSDTVHVSGLFNGKSYPKRYPIYPINITQHTHRARLPSTCSIDFTVLNVTGRTSYGLNVTEGVYYKWFSDDLEQNGTLEIEQRIYAHRERKHLLVVGITIKNFLDRNITLNLTNNYGQYSKDIPFKQYSVDKEKELEMAYGEVSKPMLIGLG